jgi:alkanesulfonate monooxygenase SsuD/methylene tetrahydromethanopterin reductase-like flavin-dependent oxidoreductase (luciferase family)
MGDGYLPNERSLAQARPYLDKLMHYLEEEGRDPAQFGLEPRLNYGDGNVDEWIARLDEWRDVGATHLSLNTMYVGFDTRRHIEALRRFAQEAGLS